MLMKKPKPTEEEIKENLQRIENGKELTIPLATLDGPFKEEYRKEVGEFERKDKKERQTLHNESSRKWYAKNKDKIKKYNRKQYLKRKKLKTKEVLDKNG